MFGWLKKKLLSGAPARSAIDVDFDDQSITIQQSNFSKKVVSWDEIERITIRTTDRGPFDDDVFVVIETSESSYWIPQAISFALFARLQELEGFDNEAVIDAMGCTDNREFVCWVRGTSGQQLSFRQPDP